MKIHLVEDWHKLLKWTSVQIALLGAAFEGAWDIMPDKMLQFLPQQYAHVGATLTFIAVMVARIIKQNGKTPSDTPDTKDKP